MGEVSKDAVMLMLEKGIYQKLIQNSQKSEILIRCHCTSSEHLSTLDLDLIGTVYKLI